MPPKDMNMAQAAWSARSNPRRRRSRGAPMDRSKSPLPRSSSMPPERSRNQAVEPATARSSSYPSRRRRTWDHPDGLPLEELETGLELPGVVVNVSPQCGVFVDIGAERNALLRMSRQQWGHCLMGRRPMFCRGDRIDRCRVKNVDLVARRLQVSIEDLDAVVAANRCKLEDLRPGMVVQGVVDHINKHGCWVNIYAETLGRLRINSARKWSNFLRGEVLGDLLIEDMDLQRRKVGLALNDPQGAASSRDSVVTGIPPDQLTAALKSGRHRGKAEAVPRREARSKSRPKAKPNLDEAEAVPRIETRTKPRPKAKPHLDEAEPRRARSKPKVTAERFLDNEYIEVVLGSSVDGIIVSKNRGGVMVDLGKGVSALLRVSPDLQAQMQTGDQVQGMKVDRVRPDGMVFLTMQDPTLEIIEMSPAKWLHPKDPTLKIIETPPARGRQAKVQPKAESKNASRPQTPPPLKGHSETGREFQERRQAASAWQNYKPRRYHSRRDQ